VGRRRRRPRGCRVSAMHPLRPLNLLTSLTRETQMHPDACVAWRDSGHLKVHLCLACY
jgi:hypothetical protein